MKKRNSWSDPYVIFTLDAVFFMCDARSPPRPVNRLGWNFGGLYSSTSSIAWGHFRFPVPVPKPEVGFFTMKLAIFRYQIVPWDYRNHLETIGIRLNICQTGFPVENPDFRVFHVLTRIICIFLPSYLELIDINHFFSLNQRGNDKYRWNESFRRMNSVER